MSNYDPYASNDTTVVEMAYDYMGRRFEYKESVNNTLTRHERHLYRGYLQIAALDMLDNASVKHTIVWDPMEPTAKRPLSLQIGANTFFYSFDQVKNVTELLDSTGALAATYDYSPFGQITSALSVESSMFDVASNPLTFSSEIHDSSLGLQYYNYRHLNVLDGRWVNRDSIGEDGGMNLYGFVGNNGMNGIDKNGLWLIEHYSFMPTATATRESGDTLFDLARKTGFIPYEIMNWARKNQKGEKFKTFLEIDAACQIYIPNRILLVMPDFEEKGILEEAFIYLKVRYAVQKDQWQRMRRRLLLLSEKYKSAGFMIDTIDFTKYGQMQLGGNVGLQDSHKVWNLMGLIIGGHGSPPYISDTAPGEIDMGPLLLKPDNFIGKDRNYHLPVLFVFSCFAGMNSWKDLAVSYSPFVFVAPKRPATLLEFPDNFGVLTWK